MKHLYDALFVFISLTLVDIGNCRSFLLSDESSDASEAYLEPPVWPDRFHAVLIRDQDDGKGGKVLSVDDLYYDWPGGNNLIIIRLQHKFGDTVDWQTNTAWYTFEKDTHKCTTRHIPFGILTKDWLHNATYEGTTTINGFECNTWSKANFITYHAEVKTNRPVRWVFFTGMSQDIIRYTVDEEPPAEMLHVPDYCDMASQVEEADPGLSFQLPNIFTSYFNLFRGTKSIVQ
mmetsp:Transcript_5401/g.7300  ORF Transcript_5401/g.7300 Transcript_5401/m.7300 type:complete len:232 (-) Transcript_5401:135-830(-)